MTAIPSRPALTVPVAPYAAATIFAAYLPFSITNGSLSAIGRATGAGTGDLQWAVDAFTVALTGAVLLGGALIGRLGRRRTIRLGMLLSFVGAVLAAASVATTVPVHVLQVGLGVAGVGGGLVMSASLALIATEVPAGPGRGPAISVWAAANVAALGAGPFIAGAAATAGLPWNAPYVVVAVLVALLALAPSGPEAVTARAVQGRFDLAGVGVGIAAVVAITIGAIAAGATGWGSAAALTPIGAGLLLLVLLVLVERRASAPVMPLALFRSAPFVVAGLAAAVALFAMIGTVFTVSVSLGSTGHTPMSIALRLGALFAGNIIGSLLAGRLQSRFGATRVLAAGTILTTLGLFTAIPITPTATAADMSWRLALIGLGAGATVATSTVLAVQSVPAHLTGSAGTINNAFRQFGAALGAAITGSVLTAAGPHTAILVLGVSAACTALGVLTLTVPHTTRQH
jgi:MFS family permease